MKIREFFSSIFTFLKTSFEKALPVIFDQFIKGSINAIWDTTKEEVYKLSASDLTNEEKRKAAYEAVKAKALAEGKFVSDALVNLAIELAVAFFKKYKR